jgi:ATP-dependent Clp protease ATP-binding subunit ClpA
MLDNLLDKFTTHFKQILIRAQNVAWQKSSDAIEPMHLLFALLQQKGSIAAEILSKQNLRPDDLQLNMSSPLNTDRLLSTNILVVLPGGKDDALTLRALSNIPHVQAVRAQDLNVLLALAFAYVIATKDALAVIEKTFAVKK